MSEQQYLSVQALTKYIKRKFDHDPHLQNIFVRGEISNFKQHTSGHMYFTLKDEKARILAVMFASQSRGMKFQPENGMKVLLRGEITVYESSGQYQIYVKEMQPDGIGDLYLAYEQLKERLQSEELFSAQHKKELPPYPHTIGIITSPTGAAIRDIITTIKRRYPVAKMVVFPALVQGDNAAPSIVKAIHQANNIKEIDILIIGRGGGSIEELWAFNEEAVARAIYDSPIPIISAVGHETDFTIADFVADLRAPTPTGAAELAVPHIEELKERLLNRQIRVIRSFKEQFNKSKKRLSTLENSYAFRYPKRLYEQKLEQLDRALERINKGSTQLIEKKKDRQSNLLSRLNRNNPLQYLGRHIKDQQLLEKRLQRSMNDTLINKEKDFTKIITHLKAVSPLNIMDRGYSLVYKDETLMKSIQTINKGDTITVSLTDGDINCDVIEVKGTKRNE